MSYIPFYDIKIVSIQFVLVNMFFFFKIYIFHSYFKKRDLLMGNKSSKNSQEQRRKRDFPLTLQDWSTGWKLTEEHKVVVEELFSRYSLQDVIGIVFSFVGQYDKDRRIYYRLIRPNLCDLNKDNTLSTSFYISPKWLKITIFGKALSGRSSLRIRTTINKFIEKYDPTIEMIYQKKIQLNNESSCAIYFLEQCGQDEFLTMLEGYARNSDCVIIAYDVTEEYYRAKETIDRYLLITRRAKEDITVIIIGTKADLRNDSLACIPHINPIIEYCTQHNLCYIETSSKENINVDFLFQYVAYNLWFDSFQE
ncbi:ras family small GTPase (RAP-1) [Reticulomyxa filosa]|uniref:Ras family small GTPase (RAP-1) n=1 Tax=Reticulomyxa filosa TaxID=46433 RepID=X6MLL7_RETFI|nr:ras family small GTPase (RAP-1) [Reticulomyxa filosa]|eukprot:ETO14546.1 ras family small GTPase (RAP-1) [Reticulomyxa filosa]